ncbi:MAG: aminodeoxychorismate synthase component I [Candidatus Scalindua sp.]|jgi:para-aminobenzoate synthetase component 1|nr:aminodeoxychorismate synthase component I [Candidatus Scalindua sp.]MDV5167122.1 aminodeoxychorismate synthase component I [Candidatus Scalindua sp.]
MANLVSKTRKKLIIKELDPCTDLLRIFHHTQAHSKNFFLDSANNNEKTGRYSFLGYDPFLTVMSKGNNILTQNSKSITRKTGNPFDVLRQLLNNFQLENQFEPIPFTCGAVGYFSYDLCHFIEKIPDTTIDDIEFPEMCFSFYDTIIAVDHLENRSFLLSVNINQNSLKSTAKRVGHVLEMIRNRSNIPHEEESQFNGSRIKRKIISNFSKENYLRAVERAKQYINAGDIYQVNLSQRFQTQIETSPYELYKRLREINPASFSSYLKFDNKYVISSSPERFLSLQNVPDSNSKRSDNVVRKIQTMPIKGTRPRGNDEKINKKMQEALLSSKKDDAELAMIVDLERNDLGRVCNYNTVKVTEKKKLEAHPTVYHLVATVEGELHSRYDAIDLLKATFPGGSITGAPKVRAMQIIDELEPNKRSVYTGSMGYLSFNGNIDFNIAIRTFLVKDDHIFFQVGGGIVADSDPEDEYQETLHKAHALIETLE